MITSHGAEVIKVEGPGGAGAGGDMIRDLFLQVAPKERQERGVGLFFEGLNCGKKSVCMDLKKKEERAAFIEMLKGADVLVTNVRPNQLAGLGLDYDDIKQELPHLIFAHLIAWGREGPDAGLAGFDMSSFWATTGIAHAIHSPPNFMYTAYPTGDFVSKMMNFASKMMNFVLKMMSFAYIVRFRRPGHRGGPVRRDMCRACYQDRERQGRLRIERALSQVKMMNFVLKMMNYVLKLMNCALKMMHSVFKMMSSVFK